MDLIPAAGQPCMTLTETNGLLYQILQLLDTRIRCASSDRDLFSATVVSVMQMIVMMTI